MATLAKPGVTVSQTLTASAPSATNSPLIPCIVGPCFAIVEPTNSSGAVNSSASISVPAMIESSATLSSTVSAASTYLVVGVDGGSYQVAVLPAVVSGSSIPLTLVPQSIMSQITGVTASIVDSKLRIVSNTTGDASSLELLSAAQAVTLGVSGITGSTPMAYTALNLLNDVDDTVYGRGNYNNRAYVFQYESLPTYAMHPGTDELVFDGDNIDIHRLYAGSLTKLSKTSAVQWSTYYTGTTKINNTAQTGLAPFCDSSRPLYPKPIGTSKSNVLVDLGVDASVSIPMCHPTRDSASDTGYPDANWQYYLYAEAKGAQAYKLDSSASVGAYAGAAGNALAIDFVPGGPDGVSFAGSTLTITYTANSTTYAGLQALIDAYSATLSPIFHEVTVVYPSGMGTAKIEPKAGGTALGDSGTWYLSGGQDPINFGSDGASSHVKLLGAVNTSTGTDPVSLLQGKYINIGVYGEDAVSVIMPSGTKTVAQLASDIDTAVDGGTGSKIDAAAGVAIKSAHYPAGSGTAIQLELKDATQVGSDSSLEVSADQEVLELLLTGFKSKTETVALGTAGEVSYTLTPGSNYNMRATAPLEKSLVHGSVEIEMGGLLVNGYAVCGNTGAVVIDASVIASPATLVLSHSGFHPSGGALGDTFSLTITHDTATKTAAYWAGLINARLAGGADGAGDGVTPAADTFIGAAAAKLNTSSSDDVLIIYSKNTTAGDTLKLVSAGSTAALVTQMKGSPAVEIFDVDLTDTLATITVEDDPSVALRSITASSSVEYPAPSGFSVLDDDTTSKITWETGVIAVKLRPEVTQAVGAYSGSVSYERGAYNFVSVGPYDITSKVWLAQPKKMQAGDKVYGGGSILGTVVRTENFVVSGAPSGWGSGSAIVLSAKAADVGTPITSWYATAENLATDGTGRTKPEVMVNDTTETITIKPNLNRGFDGIPVTGEAPLYADFKALRLDVTAAANNPALLTFSSATEVEESIGPIGAENPLALGIYAAFLNSTGVNVSAIGVDETTANAPMGTTDAYERAYDFLDQVSVYTVVPLSGEDSVCQLSSAVVDAASLDNKERITLINPAIPTEKSPTLVTSSADADASEVSAGIWNIDLGASANVPSTLSGKKDANGDTISSSVGSILTPVQGVYLTREGDHYKYLVTKIVSSRVVEIRTNYTYSETEGPGTYGNGDGFYHTSDTKLDEWASAGEAVSLWVRAAEIDTTTTAGKLQQMEALATTAAGYGSRRTYLVQPRMVGMPLDGLETLVSGVYAASGVAGMKASYKPSQPMTNLPMVGFTRVVGSNDTYSENMMATAAAGGVYWIIQESAGAPLTCRHQLSTDTSSLKAQEMSITTAVDHVSIKLRTGLSKFIGRNNITKGLLRQIGLVADAIIRSEKGVNIADGAITGISIDSTSFDTMNVSGYLDVLYPGNRIAFNLTF